MNSTIQVGILGAGGFTGQELMRIFARHPYVHLAYVTSSEYAGKTILEAFPALYHERYKNLKFSTHPQSVSDVPKLDVIFLATPDDVSLKWAPEFLNAGV
ncbi:MAG TPA: N-acetyl-gamma-glutamyl-phosphate reductase, partial [Turneriella sp.]|nr:N-acetyl-gamma-glutamyl-phosphate reductase [Turneriella sp.]